MKMRVDQTGHDGASIKIIPIHVARHFDSLGDLPEAPVIKDNVDWFRQVRGSAIKNACVLQERYSHVSSLSR